MSRNAPSRPIYACTKLKSQNEFAGNLTGASPELMHSPNDFVSSKTDTTIVTRRLGIVRVWYFFCRKPHRSHRHRRRPSPSLEPSAAVTLAGRRRLVSPEFLPSPVAGRIPVTRFLLERGS
ncbi:hypothetical protein Hanom_Chr16g01509521 [Helianthus anomalus]